MEQISPAVYIALVLMLGVLFCLLIYGMRVLSNERIKNEQLHARLTLRKAENIRLLQQLKIVQSLYLKEGGTSNQIVSATIPHIAIGNNWIQLLYPSLLPEEFLSVCEGAQKEKSLLIQRDQFLTLCQKRIDNFSGETYEGQCHTETEPSPQNPAKF